MSAESANQPGDGQLLAEFARSGDEAPFARLVRRHERLVFNACLRVLHRAADAEDAAQAVFVALASKAGEASLHGRLSLAGWLYEAAWHVSMRMKEAEKIRREREREAGTMQERLAEAAAKEWPQVSPVLDGELNELPEKYKLTIILHHLENRSVEETAALTQSSTDATKQRLSRGREMLRERLTRRGVLLSTGVVTTLLSNQASAATAPAAFAGATSKAAMLLISGNAVAGAQAALFSGPAAEAVMHAQWLARYRAPLWAAALLLFGFSGALTWSHFSPGTNAAAAAGGKEPVPPKYEKYEPPEIKKPMGKGKWNPGKEDPILSRKDMKFVDKK